MKNPFAIVDNFETELCKYVRSPYAVATSSCTDAIGICFEYLKINQPLYAQKIQLPKHTYIGVAIQAKRAGFEIKFQDCDWVGEYRIWPYNLWDSARRFTSGMYEYNKKEGLKFKCVSFHASKILGYSHGGAILHNSAVFDKWARQARFDGRPWSGDQPTVLGRHANMTPDVAAALSYKLYHLPRKNKDLPNSDYPDLSKMDIFK